MAAPDTWISDLSTHDESALGPLMVATGTEDLGLILESGPDKPLTLLRKAAGAQRSHWAMPEGVKGNIGACLLRWVTGMNLS